MDETAGNGRKRPRKKPPWKRFFWALLVCAFILCAFIFFVKSAFFLSTKVEIKL